MGRWIVLACCCFFLASMSLAASIEFPFFHDVEEMVEYWGYPFEQHAVTTEDGYILYVHRIPSANATGKVVLLQHGLGANAGVFLFGPPDKV